MGVLLLLLPNELHMIDECPVLQPLRQQYAALFSTTTDTMGSFFAQRDHMQVFNFVLDFYIYNYILGAYVLGPAEGQQTKFNISTVNEENKSPRESITTMSCICFTYRKQQSCYIKPIKNIIIILSKRTNLMFTA